MQFTTNDCEILGPGFISKGSRFKFIPSAFHAFRASMAADRIKALMGKNVVTFGVPALLSSKCYFLHEVLTTNDIGLIPHYADKANLSKSKIIGYKGIKIINVETGDIETFVNQIVSCKYIISSSLHRITLAESYGDPCFLAKKSDKFFLIKNNARKFVGVVSI